MKVFVGSSTEGKSHEAFLWVCKWIEDAGHEVVRWDQPGLFPPNHSTLEGLEKISGSVDAALLIFSADDRTRYRENDTVSPRDNVVLEYGLFTGALGRERTAVFQMSPAHGATDTPMRLASDLAGITTIRFESNAWAKLEMEVAAWLGGIPPLETNWKPPEESPDSPFQARGKESLFTTSTRLINSATHRLVLVARTPVLLMGPRPYGKPAEHVSYELRQYEAYRQIVERRRTGVGASILCLASLSSVARDLSRSGWDSLLGMVSGNYQFLHGEHESLDDSVSLLWHDSPSTMNFLVADQDFVIWLKDESQESIWITAHNEAVSNALVHMANQLSREARRYASWDDVEAALRRAVDAIDSVETR